MKVEERIANALEHLALASIEHKTCDICKAKKRPAKKMPPPVVLTPERERLRLETIRRARAIAAGGDEPIAGVFPDSFRYLERK